MTDTLPIPPHLLPGSALRHYKGGLYTVVGSCIIEATLEVGILYTPCQGDQRTLWMRPMSAFDDLIELPRGSIKRFKPA